MNIDLNKVQRFLDWLKTQLYLDTLVVNASRRVVQRGQVYRCNFGMGIGSDMKQMVQLPNWTDRQMPQISCV